MPTKARNTIICHLWDSQEKTTPVPCLKCQVRVAVPLNLWRKRRKHPFVVLCTTCDDS
jgi:hypothetical protein